MPPKKKAKEKEAKLRNELKNKTQHLQKSMIKINKIQNVLKAKKYKGKHNNKSCVSWKIQGEPTDNNKIIWFFF